MSDLPDAERYTVFLNPYPDHRFTRCPRCDKETHERNRVLVLQLGPRMVVPIMATCRYCASCDLLIPHQDELAATLRQMLPPEEQESVEESMTIIGTLDRGRLRRGGFEEMTPSEALEAFRPVRELVHFDLVQREAGNIEMVETAVPYPQMEVEIPTPQMADVQALPQAEEVWQVAAMKMWAWITGEEGESYRPYLVLVASPDGPLMLFQEMLRTQPSTAQVRDVLLKAMSQPAGGAGTPRRPTVVVTDDEDLADALAPEMAPLGIRCTTEDTPELDDMLAELEYFLAGGHEPIPGLLDDPRVTPEQVGELFEAAADFYREAPWELMLDEDLVALRYPAPDGKWRFASVMGNAGLEFGLAVFDDLFDYDLVASTPPEDAIGMMNYRSITYDDMTTVPFADLDALEQYGWEIAEEDAYPIPFQVTEDEEVLRPGPDEIDWYTIALRAVTAFFQEYWPDETDFVAEPVSTTLRIPLAGRRVAVELRYPADLVTDED